MKYNRAVVSTDVATYGWLRPIAVLTVAAVVLIVGATPGPAARKKSTSGSVSTPSTSAVQSRAGIPKSPTAVSPVASPTNVTKDLTGGRPILRRGPLSTFSTVPVTNAQGTTTISYAQFADKVLKVPRERNARLGAARAGLLADPVVAEEVVDTDESSILLSTTTFTVTDPSIVKASVPELFRRTPTGMTTAKMNPAQRKAFDTFKANLVSKPAGDPLKAAAAISDDALIAAIVEGKGEQTLTSRVVLEKKIPRVANDFVLSNNENVVEVVAKAASATPTAGSATAGSATAGSATAGSAKAKRAAGSSGAATRRTPKTAKGDSAIVKLSSFVAAKAAPPTKQNTVSTKVKTSATTTTVSPYGEDPYALFSGVSSVELLAGFTIGDTIQWDTTIDVGIGEFTVGAVATYSFGLRIPMKLNSEMTPAKIGNQFTTGGKALATNSYNYDIALTASVSDADADYYRRVGVAEADVQAGKELVVFGDVYVFIEGKILGIAFDGRFPGKPLIDWGSNFTPPFGNCGTNCGFDVWVPAALTHTEINLLGIASGSGQLGFNISGTGTVGVNYESLVDGKVVASSLGAGAPSNLNAWSSDGVGFVPKLKTTIAAVNAATRESFGFRLTKPTYKWDVVVTPEVKFDVAYDLVLFKDSYALGPYEVGALAFSLGTLTLNAHEGTTNTYTYTLGEYVESKCTKAGLEGCEAEKVATTVDAVAAVPITTISTGKGVGTGKVRSTPTTGVAVQSPVPSTSLELVTATTTPRRRATKAVTASTTIPATSPVVGGGGAKVRRKKG